MTLVPSTRKANAALTKAEAKAAAAADNNNNNNNSLVGTPDPILSPAALAANRKFDANNAEVRLEEMNKRNKRNAAVFGEDEDEEQQGENAPNEDEAALNLVHAEDDTVVPLPSVHDESVASQPLAADDHDVVDEDATSDFESPQPAKVGKGKAAATTELTAAARKAARDARGGLSKSELATRQASAAGRYESIQLPALELWYAVVLTRYPVQSKRPTTEETTSQLGIELLRYHHQSGKCSFYLSDVPGQAICIVSVWESNV